VREFEFLSDTNPSGMTRSCHGAVDASHVRTLAVARPARHVERAQVVSERMAQGEPAIFRASSNLSALTTSPGGT
jgi:hypothetical protein